MAEEKHVDAAKEVAKSKRLLEKANKFTTQVEGKPRGMFAPAPKPAIEAPKPKSAGLLAEAESAGAGLKAREANVNEYVATAPKMHNGGKVQEDGVKDLQKGETVLPKDKKKAEKLAMAHLGKKAGAMSAAVEEEKAEKETPKQEKAEGKKGEKAEKHTAPKKEKKLGKHDFARTEIIHHPNGSHTSTHHYRPAKMGADGKMPEQREPMTYASPDFASMHQGMEDNLGGGPAAAEQAPE